MYKNVYIIGAGLAGLSASVHGIKNNLNVKLFESSNLVGGRCRSFFDKKLGLEIDNGNHLVFSANNSFYELCEIIKSTKKINTLPPKLQFFDKKKQIHWSLDLNKISLKEVFSKKDKLIPESRIYDYLSILKFIYVKKKKTVSDVVGDSKIFSTFWDPLTLGVMNTPSESASAKVLSNVLKKTLFRGSKFCHIYQPKINWNDALIKPSIEFLNKNGCEIQLKKTLKKIDINNNFVSRLYFNNDSIKIMEDDLVLLAIPPTNFSKFFPNHDVPKKYNSIVNIHFKLPYKLKKKLSKPIVGFINSYTHWIFVKKNYLSVTISNANNLNSLDSNEIANTIWKEICSYIETKINITEYQVVKEKKATIVQSPKNFEMIKNLSNLPTNLKISGDWTQGDLPCTIEGSILSGKKAVNVSR